TKYKLDSQNETFIITDVPNSTIPPEKTHQVESILTHDTPLPWLNFSAEPINEFTTVGYVAMAFPVLFSTEATDFRSLLRKSVSPLQYFQHLLNTKIGKFARNPIFRYFAVNSIGLTIGLLFQNGKICLQRNTDVSSPSNKFRDEPGLVHRLMCFNSSVRGTTTYWLLYCGEVMDMIQQWGSSTLFFIECS
ncbi:hypothetical protein AVEN_44726-1, partial [Araneus ventricosus]